MPYSRATLIYCMVETLQCINARGLLPYTLQCINTEELRPYTRATFIYGGV